MAVKGIIPSVDEDDAQLIRRLGFAVAAVWTDLSSASQTLILEQAAAVVTPRKRRNFASSCRLSSASAFPISGRSNCRNCRKSRRGSLVAGPIAGNRWSALRL
jgi:hypothetical protein